MEVDGEQSEFEILALVRFRSLRDLPPMRFESMLLLPVVAVLLFALEGKVLVGDGTPLEDDGVFGNPGTGFSIVGIITIETTGLGHDVSTKLGVDGNVIHGDLDGLGGGDSGGGCEEGGGTEEHG